MSDACDVEFHVGHCDDRSNPPLNTGVFMCVGNESDGTEVWLLPYRYGDGMTMQQGRHAGGL